MAKVNPFDSMNHTTSKANEDGIKPKKRVNKQQVDQKKQKSVQNPIAHKEQPKPQAKKETSHVKIPGYSTIRISREDVVNLKAGQEVLKFKNRSDLINDMWNQYMMTHLSTPKKKAKYHSVRKSIINILRIKGKIK